MADLDISEQPFPPRGLVRPEESILSARPLVLFGLALAILLLVLILAGIFRRFSFRGKPKQTLAAKEIFDYKKFLATQVSDESDLKSTALKLAFALRAVLSDKLVANLQPATSQELVSAVKHKDMQTIVEELVRQLDEVVYAGQGTSAENLNRVRLSIVKLMNSEGSA
jgi:hypothetical protein